MTVFFIPKSGRKYSIQTLIISPWLLFRKMIISQLCSKYYKAIVKVNPRALSICISRVCTRKPEDGPKKHGFSFWDINKQTITKKSTFNFLMFFVELSFDSEVLKAWEEAQNSTVSSAYIRLHLDVASGKTCTCSTPEVLLKTHPLN